MTCRELADFIGDYLDGELSPQVLAAFERHLTLCANCGAYLADYDRARRAGGLAFSGSDEDVPAEVPEDLVQAVLAARRSN